jgi:hypothetical protein
VRFYDIEWQIVANVAGSPLLLEKEHKLTRLSRENQI